MNPSTETSGKPADIPQDVWRQARAVFVAYSKVEGAAALLAIANGEYDGYPMITIAARAILAAKAEEREACALLIDEGFDRVGVKSKLDECDHGRFGYEDCEQCASAAIRKRGEG